jgi:hypothetical protein
MSAPEPDGSSAPTDTPDRAAGSRTRRPSRRARRAKRRKRIIWWSVAGVLVLLIGATAWIGVRAVLAKDELQQAVPLAKSVKAQVVAGDTAAAGKTADALRTHAVAAAQLTSDPIWRAAEIIPFVGPNLAAVREVAGATSQISTGAVSPLVRLAGKLTPAQFKPVDGAVDVQPLIDAQADVRVADDVLEAANNRVRSIDTSKTIGVVTSAVDELRPVLAEASSTADAARRAVDLLPAMLGADGPRNYLVLFQNNAEPRSTGGNPGAVALIGTNGGKVSMLQQASTSDFPPTAEPVLPLPLETRGIYGDITGRYLQDVNLTPRFPMSAELAREMWKQRFGTEVDGVLSIDPVALGYLLSATGPVTLETGDVLTSENVVDVLLSQAYARYSDPADQNVFFASAAAAVFERVAGGDFDPAKLLAALAKSGEERRTIIWSAHQDEQTEIAGTTLAGELPASDRQATRFGVYLNDATGSKMGYYLDADYAIGQKECRQDGRAFVGLRVTLRNNAPADAASTLSDYVTGGGTYGVPAGNIRITVSVYGPQKSLFQGATRDGAELSPQTASDGGFPVTHFEVEIAPGQSTEIDLGTLTEPGSSSSLEVVSTPTVHTTETQKLATGCQLPLQ